MKKAKSILALLMAFVMLMSFAVTGSAATSVEETEDNGTSKTADAFGFGTEIKGALGDANDVDWYSFTNDASGLASVTLKHNEIVDASKNLAYFEVVIYDSTAAKQIATFRSTGADKATASPSFAIDANATYYVKVVMGTVHSETLGYSLVASFDKGAYTEKEPNNISANATNLELSVSGSAKHYYGTIAPAAANQAADVDWYRVAPTANGVIYLYLYNGTTPSDFKATLFTHDETKDGALVEVEISSIQIDSNTDSATSVAIGITAKEYMLKVEGLNGKTGGYRTRVYFEKSGNAEWEYNGTPETANTITLGNALKGTISQASDTDVYRFQAINAENIGFNISLGSFKEDSKETGSWYITVKDATDGSVVSEIYKKEVKAGKPVVFATESLVAGRYYYITVEKGGNLNTETYILGITAIEPDKDDGNLSGLDFFSQIKVYWDQFMKNFEGWFEQINISGLLANIVPSIVTALPTLFTWLFSLVG